MQTLPWIVALSALALLAVALSAWAWNVRSMRRRPATLPTEWALTARPVFSTDERRVYRLLREALPHHVVLSKLALVRFCQPTDPARKRYWYDLLGTSQVSFAVCSANGRVLAAIDLDPDRSSSRRVGQIKQAVLSACRVRYLRCPVDHLPSVSELQMLVPSPAPVPRAPQPAPAADLHQARDSLAHTVASRRAERTALWQDSTVFQDSFFTPDSRMDGYGQSGYSPLAPLAPLDALTPDASPSAPRRSVPDSRTAEDWATGASADRLAAKARSSADTARNFPLASSR